ncbi:MAG: ABC transporter permease [Bacillota bacterium]
MRYVLRKIISSSITLFVIVSLTFVLMHLIPGGPFDSERKLPDSIVKNLNARYNLDKPLREQYIIYIKNVLTGDLGPSIKYENKTVNSIIKEGFPVTAAIGVAAIFLAVFVGSLLGVAAAIYRQRWPDYAASIISTLGISVPGFILAGFLVYLFAFRLGWFPPALWDGPKSMALPVLSLAWFPTAIIARLMKSSVLEVLNQEYIKTARAKGLPMSYIVIQHVLRNAAAPMISYVGPALATILTGSFVIENIFALPGLGKWFVLSISNRDYTVILGLTIFYSTLLIVLNILVDLVLAVLDPRIRYTKAKGAGL